MKKSHTSKHPTQPLYRDNGGTLRFKRNAIVEFLVENGGYNLNALATMDFSDADWEQLAQLIGYSLSGFADLSYVSDETYKAAVAQLDSITERPMPCKTIEEALEVVTELVTDLHNESAENAIIGTVQSVAVKRIAIELHNDGKYYVTMQTTQIRTVEDEP